MSIPVLATNSQVRKTSTEVQKIISQVTDVNRHNEKRLFTSGLDGDEFAAFASSGVVE